VSIMQNVFKIKLSGYKIIQGIKQPVKCIFNLDLNEFKQGFLKYKESNEINSDEVYEYLYQCLACQHNKSKIKKMILMSR